MTPNQRANLRAAYLAHECGLDWGAWALNLWNLCPRCRDPLTRVRNTGALNEEQFDAVKRGDWYCPGEACADRRPPGETNEYFNDPLPHLPVPEDIADWHAPYLADCERRGVEPGPLPARYWSSDDDTFAWCATSDGFVSARVHAVRWTSYGMDTTGRGTTRLTAADLARFAQLVAAIERADAAADKDGAT